MSITVQKICVYPVKGLSPQLLDEATLRPGDGVPGDRRFALVHASSAVDPMNPTWAQKRNFLALVADEKLAQLEARHDLETNVLTLFRKGHQVARGSLTDPTGRMLIEQFLAAFMPAGPRGNPKIVEKASEQSFTDNPENHVSIINLASVKDIERIVREPVDPVRFRGNVYLDGAGPWQEFGWVGKEITIGGVRGLVTERIDRCRATCVNPDTGDVDMNVPLALRQGFGHIDCGVFFRVLDAGTVRSGDTLEPPSAA